MFSRYILSTKWIVVLVGSIDNVLCTLMLCLHAHRTKVKTGENIIIIHRENIAFLGSQNNEIKMRYLQFKTHNNDTKQIQESDSQKRKDYLV